MLHGAITGNYEKRWHDPHSLDCIQVHSFGTDISPQGVNSALAHYALHERTWNPLPLLADRVAAEALKALPDEIDNLIVVGGHIGDGIRSERPGTWGALVAMKEIMDQQGWNNPELVGHAHHIGRITIQALKLGMDPRVPSLLPNQFDRSSGQVWTRRRIFWIPYEFAATIKLKHDGQL
jgi:hypothetical protein